MASLKVKLNIGKVICFRTKNVIIKNTHHYKIYWHQNTKFLKETSDYSMCVLTGWTVQFSSSPCHNWTCTVLPQLLRTWHLSVCWDDFVCNQEDFRYYVLLYPFLKMSFVGLKKPNLFHWQDSWVWKGDSSLPALLIAVKTSEPCLLWLLWYKSCSFLKSVMVRLTKTDMIEYITIWPLGQLC